MEFGARALGNRSILANAQDPNMQSKLNQVIKKREEFRPFAPSVTEEEDNTCRVQTVSKKDNMLYYNLLKEIGKETGHEVVLNTSFNLKDQTITMTPRQALERFVYSDIDFLVIGEYFIHKR